jgi:carbamoyl-phosphate synthase small subunit
VAFSVQYHPEAAAGPHDAAYLFDRFCDLMSGGLDSARPADGAVSSVETSSPVERSRDHDGEDA